MADYYEILGVSRGASAPEIKQAYLRLVRERHPDRFPDPAERDRAQEFFKSLTTAYNTLSNDRTRSEYDRDIDRPKPVGPEEVARDAFARAAHALEGRQFDEAAVLLRTAVHNAPGEARYHAALGRLLGKSPQFVREAVEALERATQLAPREAAYHAELALVLVRGGLRLRARKAAEVAQRLAPHDPAVQKVVHEVGLGDHDGPGEGGGLLGGLRRRKP
jgi:curved DNA-binding protein CbpA